MSVPISSRSRTVHNNHRGETIDLHRTGEGIDLRNVVACGFDPQLLGLLHCTTQFRKLKHGCLVEEHH